MGSGVRIPLAAPVLLLTFETMQNDYRPHHPENIRFTKEIIAAHFNRRGIVL
jgi:hypothetical protein